MSRLILGGRHSRRRLWRLSLKGPYTPRKPKYLPRCMVLLVLLGVLLIAAGLIGGAA